MVGSAVASTVESTPSMNMALATIRAVMREFGARDTCGAADVAGPGEAGVSG
jgi:hypothetical protein